MCTIVLDFFARILHFGQTKGRGRALQKVAEGREIRQLLFLPNWASAAVLLVDDNEAGTDE